MEKTAISSSSSHIYKYLKMVKATSPTTKLVKVPKRTKRTKNTVYQLPNMANCDSGTVRGFCVNISVRVINARTAMGGSSPMC